MLSHSLLDVDIFNSIVNSVKCKIADIVNRIQKRRSFSIQLYFFLFLCVCIINVFIVQDIF